MTSFSNKSSAVVFLLLEFDFVLDVVIGSTELVPGLATRLIRFDKDGKLRSAGMKPVLGTEIVLLDDAVRFSLCVFVGFLFLFLIFIDHKGKELPKTDSDGHMCIKRIWPGMVRTIKNNHDAYLDEYIRPYPGEINGFLITLIFFP